MKECVLYDRVCIGCGECDRCDLDPDKICDNCGKCLETGKAYAEIKIDEVILPEELRRASERLRKLREEEDHPEEP